MSNVKYEKNSLVPRLRFPEFRDKGEWENESLNKLLVETKKRNRQLSYSPKDVLSVSGKYGCVNQIKLLGRSYAGASVKDYHVVETGDIVYTKSPLKKNPFGIIKENKGESGIVSTLYAVYRVTDKGYPAYLDHYFSRDYHLNSYLQPIVRKGAKNDMKVNNLDVLSGKINTPGLEEQKRIADCLSSLNELILVEGQKLDTPKSYESALMRQLFPRDDETVPQVRFPEFLDANEWEPTTVGQLVNFKSGGTPSKGNPAFWNGSIPWASAKDMKKLFLDDTEDHITTAAADEGARQVPAGTVLILTRGMTLLKDVPVCILNRQMSFNQDVKALEPKGDIDGRFLAYLLRSCKQRLLRLVDIAGHGTGRLDTDKLKFFDVMLAPPAEQQRIADCLTSLNSLITAQIQKIEDLAVHKKGLMQQIFPAFDEAQV
ncbi:restriction endonuclease subunit S [Pseudomonas viridiflava]|uniref:restriction endonuclease subunit S n=2 Tax=Pseudomonas viridiflava TaxID=33069 RepID=UPI0013DE8B93|nr:restriction endonuclease subunit S [Pseudomonas viridiflava]